MHACIHTYIQIDRQTDLHKHIQMDKNCKSTLAYRNVYVGVAQCLCSAFVFVSKCLSCRFLCPLLSKYLSDSGSVCLCICLWVMPVFLSTYGCVCKCNPESARLRFFHFCLKLVSQSMCTFVCSCLCASLCLCVRLFVCHYASECWKTSFPMYRSIRSW